MRQALQGVIDRCAAVFATAHPTAFWVAVSQRFRGSSVEYVPVADSPLHHGSAAVRLIVDSTIFPYTFAKGEWQFGDVERLLATAKPQQSYVLVDIGANIGLFTRQMLIAAGNRVTRFICVEPERLNFATLEHNVAPFLDRGVLINAAVSDTDGTARLTIDRDNIGHHSLIVGSGSHEPDGGVDVPMISGSTLSDIVLAKAREQAPAARLLVKCDTEGFDEIILTNLTDDLWTQVDGCIIEILQIEKPALDWARLEAIIASFPSRHWADAPDRPVSSAEAIEFARQTRGIGRDLILSR